MHAFRPLAIVLLTVWISCCSCASFDDLKKWGQTLSLGGGLVGDAGKEIETSLSAASSSSARPFLTASRLSRAPAKFTEGQPSFAGPQIHSLQEQFRAAESYAAFRFSREALLSGVARTRWVKPKTTKARRTNTYVFSPEDQAVLLNYIRTRMLAQMDTAKNHPNLVSKVRFTVNPTEPPEDYWERAYGFYHNRDPGGPASNWRFIQSSNERTFDLGALRFRMIKAKYQDANAGNPEIGLSYVVIARPLEGAEAQWGAYVGDLRIPGILTTDPQNIGRPQAAEPKRQRTGRRPY